MSAGWFFDKNGLDKLAETPGVEDDTRAINGGEIGLADRRAKFNSLVIELLRRQS
jgi:predicted chitinase